MPDAKPSLDPSVAAVDRALDILRRKLAPRGMRRISDDHQCEGGAHTIPLLAAIAGDADGEVTVGGLAATMCVDPSRASRMVTAAIDAGHVRRLASQADGRRTVLELTDDGRAVLATAGEFWKGRYGNAMADWTERERREFARLLTRFCDGLD
ncbi:MAG TPA: MarR family winged helix-turn-helix transcriptional regulator [Candidatus Limnocylindrales bacterium]